MLFSACKESSVRGFALVQLPHAWRSGPKIALVEFSSTTMTQEGFACLNVFDQIVNSLVSLSEEAFGSCFSYTADNA